MMQSVAVGGNARHGIGGLVGLLAMLAVASPTRAQQFSEPVDRYYTIDLYLGQALGSSRIIGMGGTATATAKGSSGMIANPAAPAVRATNSHDNWDWDWHLDSMSPSLGSDHDNNGIDTRDVSFTPSVTFGAVVQYKNWGFGVGATGLAIENGSSAGAMGRIKSEALINQLVVARHFLDGDLVAGIAARSVILRVSSLAPAESEQTLLQLAGGGAEAGVVWKPRNTSIRIGTSLRLPVISDETTIEACDPLNCVGYVLPNKVKIPWQASVGIAGRRAPLAWNRTSHQRWVDEKALMWAVDVVLTGTTSRGAGLEAFGLHQLQPSGRKHSLSIRGGVDYEWYPGRLRVRGGSYYEPSRFRDPQGQEIGGRLHLTFGGDVRIWQFGFWDDLYRVRLSLTSDVARRFGNGGLSIGFWH